jgi:signal transduction histidine kinase
MSQPLKVLLVEDRADDALLIQRCLTRAGYEPEITRVETEAAMRSALVGAKPGIRPFDIVLSSYGVRRFSCQAALDVLHSAGLDIPFIALSGTVNEETILTLLRAGAGDYVMKDNLARLPSSVDREIREAEGRRQRQRLEVQLQQAMKMEAIGRLAGGVAHDFNNLLTVIAGFAQLALLDDNPARAGLEQILLAAERASGLTRQLLAFSRQQALEPRVFDLNQLVRDMEKMLRRLIGEDIEVVTRIAEQPLMVKADPGQIEQVLLNLAVNSRDAMPSGGKLILSTGPRKLEGTVATMNGVPAGEYCTISVSDTGTGIPPEVLPHIFEPFFTTKPEGKGTGLGLSTVYGIVQQSGGVIHAYSEKNLGTTMTVFLPGTTSKSELLHAPPIAAMGSGTETVLVAEDDENVLYLVAHSLNASGFHVLQAPNGEEALELLHAQGPAGVDVLITDVVMPGISGPLLATRAAELLPGLKILFMSGYTEEVIQHHGISRSQVAFMQKPFAPSELVRKVRQLLDHEKASALTGKA